jgi:predicted HicB family RNase H-like nuclease
MNNNTEISDQSRGTRSITFRLESSILDKLQHEADQKEISLNVLINQTLKRYCQWDRYENRIGMMPVPKIMLS